LRNGFITSPPSLTAIAHRCFTGQPVPDLLRLFLVKNFGILIVLIRIRRNKELTVNILTGIGFEQNTPYL
tara:strand:- start:599 stop:808 length:210 start_codon:yes stop_codon:yes gene_type:complete